MVFSPTEKRLGCFKCSIYSVTKPVIINMIHINNSDDYLPIMLYGIILQFIHFLQQFSSCFLTLTQWKTVVMKAILSAIKLTRHSVLCMILLMLDMFHVCYLSLLRNNSKALKFTFFLLLLCF